MATMYLMSGKLTERVGNGHFVHVPYNTFRTQTRPLIIAVITDGFWAELVDLLGDETLRDPAFTTQPGRLAQKAFIEARVQASFEQASCEHWLAALAQRRIPAAPVNDISHAFEDEQTWARDMRVKVPLPGGGYVEEPGNPVKLSNSGKDVFTAPPRLGEHTTLVLSEIGLTRSELAGLRAEGVIEAETDPASEVP